MGSGLAVFKLGWFVKQTRHLLHPFRSTYVFAGVYGWPCLQLAFVNLRRPNIPFEAASFMLSVWVPR